MKALHIAFLRSIHFLVAIVSSQHRSSRSLRSFNAWVLSLLMLTVPIAPLAAAPSREARKAAKLDTTSSTEATERIGNTQVASRADDQPLVPEAVTITASLTDDIGLAAKKNPSDTITYTAVITNSGAVGEDATGVVFTDTLDINTTFVGGSLNAQPIAKADSYAGSGNIPISIAAPGVLTNDIDPMTNTNAGLTVTEVQGLVANVGTAANTTAAGRFGVNGSVTLNADGSFTYEPPPGFVGNDTFTYKTSEGVLTDTNTVTITISNMVWFIRNTGGGSNRGTFSNPFTSIAAYNTANAGTGAVPDPKNGDFVSLRSGTYCRSRRRQSTQYPKTNRRSRAVQYRLYRRCQQQLPPIQLSRELQIPRRRLAPPRVMALISRTAIRYAA